VLFQEKEHQQAANFSGLVVANMFDIFAWCCVKSIKIFKNRWLLEVLLLIHYLDRNFWMLCRKTKAEFTVRTPQ